MSFETKILNADEQNIAILVQHLRSDELVAVPSETVYGLAGRGLSESAMRKIFAAKERPLFDPLILHIASPSSTQNSNWQTLLETGLIQVEHLPKNLISSLEKLVNQFWPGPLTLVLPRSAKVSDIATSGLETVAIRMPAHPVFQSLLQALGEPLAAPSANRFGRISPTESAHVYSELKDRIGYILEGGNCQYGVESSIVGFELSQNSEYEFIMYRPGSLSLEDLEKASGAKIRRALHADKPIAPGMLKSHYAPKKAFSLQEQSIEQWDSSVFLKILEHCNSKKQVGILLAKTAEQKAYQVLESKNIPLEQIQILRLSEGDDSFQAAKNLFKYLRILDASSVESIFAEIWPDEKALGFAIQDRMKRAAAK